MDGIEEKSKFDFLRWGAIFLVVFVCLALIGGGIFVYQKSLKSKEEKSIAPEPTVSPSESRPTEMPQISPSPTPKLNRADLKIKILNGTGVPGAAGKAANFLEKLGWVGIKTGNADNFDYSQTVIKIKESKKDYLSLITEDLSKNYSLAKENEILPEEEKFDVIIILGKD